MYQASITIQGEKKPVLTLSSENRKAMRALALLCQENELICVVTVEVAPREVKFKNIEG